MNSFVQRLLGWFVVIRTPGPAALLLLSSITPAALAASPEAKTIAELIETYNAIDSRQTRLLIPDAAGNSRLLAGGVVNYREQVPGPGKRPIYRVVAYVIVPQPRIRVWAATLGSTERHENKLIEVAMSTDSAGGAVWYQYLSLPWPIADRHWVLRTSKRREISESSAHRIWEHSWDLEPDGPAMAANLIEAGKVSGLRPGAYRKAIYLTVNSGGWIMAQIDAETTLVALYTTAELGGHLPDKWVARYVGRKLSKVLGKLSVRAQWAEHTLDGRIPLYTGTGKPITSQMLGVSHVK